LADDLPPRKIECRKCGTVFRIPARDEESGPARRRKAQAGSAVLIWVLAGAATLVLLLVVGIVAVVGAFWLLREPAKIQGGVQVEAKGLFLPPQPGQPGQPPLGGVGPKLNVGPGQAGTQVGMTAPEIDGEDIDGQRFKLSDYRGKVVLLDFWGHW
jgi:hypothetical protein